MVGALVGMTICASRPCRRRKCDRLSVITTTVSRSDLDAPFVTSGDGVHGAAKLKGSYSLILLAFEVQVATRQFIERARRMNWGAMGTAFDPCSSGSNCSEVGSVEIGCAHGVGPSASLGEESSVTGVSVPLVAG